MPVLTVSDLSIGYVTDRGETNRVVRDVSIELIPGQILGLVGESGSGKSTLAIAASGYRTRGIRILNGQSVLETTDLLKLRRERLQSVWGKKISFVPQNSGTALNPAITVGRQMTQPLRRHTKLSAKGAYDRVVELLQLVGIPNPEQAWRRYPHQYSGGQQQRIALALAVSCRPKVLILDEPTSSLDVITQRHVNKLICDFVSKYDIAGLYISHDLSVISKVAYRVGVMRNGRIVESGMVRELFDQPNHEYTRELLAAVPTIPQRATKAHLKRGKSTLRASCSAINKETDARERDNLLDICNASILYKGAEKAAVQDVSFQVRPGEIVGIVGESGSGKSSLLRAIAGLHDLHTGELRYKGEAIPSSISKRDRAVKRGIQLAFQNPDAVLNPRHTVFEILQRPIRLHRNDVPKAQEVEVILQLLRSIQLPESMLKRFPPQLSGGQRQRVALARAFATQPELLLCDEVTSALDVTVQARIVQLIKNLSEQFSSAVIFVSHDIGLVSQIASRIVVMQFGEVTEIGFAEDILYAPQHPYTTSLIDAVPKSSLRSQILESALVG